AACVARTFIQPDSDAPPMPTAVIFRRSRRDTPPNRFSLAMVVGPFTIADCGMRIADSGSVSRRSRGVAAADSGRGGESAIRNPQSAIGSMVQRELAAVEQRPEDVAVALRRRVGLLDEGGHLLELLGGRAAGQSGEVQLLDDLVGGLAAPDEG